MSSHPLKKKNNSANDGQAGLYPIIPSPYLWLSATSLAGGRMAGSPLHMLLCTCKFIYRNLRPKSNSPSDPPRETSAPQQATSPSILWSQQELESLICWTNDWLGRRAPASSVKREVDLSHVQHRLTEPLLGRHPETWKAASRLCVPVRERNNEQGRKVMHKE